MTFSDLEGHCSYFKPFKMQFLIQLNIYVGYTC